MSKPRMIAIGLSDGEWIPIRSPMDTRSRTLERLILLEDIPMDLLSNLACSVGKASAIETIAADTSLPFVGSR
jgi:hypothetical protein